MTSQASTRDERRPFILCADDFAITGGVSRAILALLAAGRLSATCAMTNRPHWPVQAKALKDHAGHADLGLHLNLTCATPCGPMPLVAPGDKFSALAMVGRLAATSRQARAEIATEIERQLDAYEQAMATPPDFIDGHQHVHVLPGVRQALLTVLTRRYGAQTTRVYIRNPADRISAIRARNLFAAKALVVRTLASGLRRAIGARGFGANDGFAGFSDFNPARDYGAAFQTYLLAAGPKHLVMCHPGHVDDELRSLDPVLDAREKEFEFLMSDRFDEILQKAGMRLGRYSDFVRQ